MSKNEYKVIRKLQEQSGSYYVALPKLWIEANELQQSDELLVFFNGIVKVMPLKEVKSNEKQ